MNLSLTSCLFLCLWLLNALVRAQGFPPLPPDPELDLLHYQFALTLSDSTDRIMGQATLKFRSRVQGKASLSLHLVNADKGRQKRGMKVLGVWQGKQPLPYEHQQDQLRVHLVAPLDSNQLDSLRIHYQGVPSDGLIISKNKYGDRTFFGDNWPNRARHWLPVIDHPGDKATCEFIVTAPEQYEVIANGKLHFKKPLPGKLVRHHWYSRAQLPTKVMVIGVADFAIEEVGVYEGIPVSSWVYPQNQKEGFYDYEIAFEILQFMEEHIGPYPYEKLANVQSTTRFGGMENASNIFYAESSVTGQRTAESLIAHEIAHQWFGNSASEKDWAHLWLSEGFATYLAELYMEATYGPEQLAKGMQINREQVIQRAPHQPVVKPDIQDLMALLNANSYQKGAWVLHMLRHQVGNDLFWQGIRNYYQRYQEGNADTHAFQQVMEQVSGQDLAAFFTQWLYRPGHPRLKIEADYLVDDKKLLLKCIQLTEMPFLFSLDLGIIDPRGELKSVDLLFSEQEQFFEIPLDAYPNDLQLDPWVKLLFEAELNWDRPGEK